MRAGWVIAITGVVACAESTGGTGATDTLPTVVSSPSKCIEQRDAVLAGAPPEGLPVARTSGNSSVVPDSETRQAINTYGVNRIESWFTVCVEATGTVQKVDVKQTSCFPRYDRQVADRIATWKFAALPSEPTACGVVKFSYDQGDRRSSDGHQL